MRESGNAHELFRLDVAVYVSAELAPRLTYLVRAEGPAAAAGLVIDRIITRWPTYRSVEVVLCWSYPPGKLVLSGAQTLELSGATLVPIADMSCSGCGRPWGAIRQQPDGALTCSVCGRTVDQ